MRYFQSTIERSLYYLVFVMMIAIVVLGLFTYSAYVHEREIIQQDTQTVAQLNAIVRNHTGTLSTINNGFDGLNQKVNCIFQYFATEGHNSNTTISLTPNQQVCNVNINPITAPVGSSSSTKSGGQ
jgi:hypothetical protein